MTYVNASDILESIGRGWTRVQQKMFKAKCVEKGMSTPDIARILGINEATLYRKISGESDFTRNEIQLFRQALGLTSCEMDAIFFA